VSTDVNALVVIESLSPKETSTGALLLQMLDGSLPIGSQLVHVQTAEELFGVLASVEQNARTVSAWRPVLHLEMHGDAAKQGLVLASREFVKWEGLCDAVRRVNVAVRNSLVLVLGTCHGASVLAGVASAPFQRSPFYGVIGPDDQIYDGYLPAGFNAFYRSLCETRDFAVAVDSLRARSLLEYGGYDTAQLFRMALRAFENLATGASLSERAERIALHLPSSAAVAARGEDSLRTALATEIQRTTVGGAPVLYRHFIMADLYPENEKRFPLFDAA
jgi:hypothetical protein